MLEVPLEDIPAKGAEEDSEAASAVVPLLAPEIGLVTLVVAFWNQLFRSDFFLPGANVFASKSSCFRCHAPKPDGMSTDFFQFSTLRSTKHVLQVATDTADEKSIAFLCCLLSGRWNGIIMFLIQGDVCMYYLCVGISLVKNKWW